MGLGCWSGSSRAGDRLGTWCCLHPGHRGLAASHCSLEHREGQTLDTSSSRLSPLVGQGDCGG